MDWFLPNCHSQFSVKKYRNVETLIYHIHVHVYIYFIENV